VDFEQIRKNMNMKMVYRQSDEDFEPLHAGILIPNNQSNTLLPVETNSTSFEVFGGLKRNSSFYLSPSLQSYYSEEIINLINKTNDTEPDTEFLFDKFEMEREPEKDGIGNEEQTEDTNSIIQGARSYSTGNGFGIILS
jgi:uncharacterized membrane protein